jgi:group I intron endonuclease
MNKVNARAGVYRIVNKKTGKVYVGSSKDLRARKYTHFCQHPNGNPGLREDMKAYGKDGFVFEVLCYCENDKELLHDLEQTVIDVYDFEDLYNICPTAGSTLGRECTEETKRKLSEALKGVNNPMYGKQRSEETKRKISEAKVDQTIYSFQHKDGHTFTGTVYELRTKYGLNKGNLSNVINKKRTSTGGWSVMR